jgi:nitrite reductase/ring-hydroxylating ferredoxin subunit
MSLGPLSELAVGASKVYDLGGPKLAAFNVDGVVHVLSNECSHQAGPLGEGKLEGFSVNCPLHQWKFDVTTGQCLSVSGSSVRKWDSAVVKDEICVKVGGRLVVKPPAAVAAAPVSPPPVPDLPPPVAEAPASVPPAPPAPEPPAAPSV